ncbi:MAG TPA: SPOR domain-containing protein [Balneolaceae bacterium]
MAIDKDQLISLLVEKTGSGPEDVDRQLSQLIFRIRNAAEQGKSFEIEGLGTFNLENDQLQFTPDDVLETEINNKYTGMKPIELIGAFKGADVDAGDIEITGPPPVERPKTEAEIEKERWSFDETSAAEQARIEKAVFGKTFDDADEEIPEAPSETVEAPEAVEPKGDPVVRKQEAVPESDEDPIGKVLTVAAVALVLAVAGWLIYEWGFTGSYTMSDQNSLQNQTVQTRTSPREVQVSTVDVTGGQAADGSEPIQSAGVTLGDDEAISEPPSRYGLTGEINNSISTGYTIVVHSLNLEKARAIKEMLHAEGFRVMIMDAVVNGSTYYRVGLGQFPSIEAAQQASNQLPEKFQNDNFIKRF